MFFFLNIAVLNISGKFPTITSATKLVSSLVMSFQHVLSYKWFSGNFQKIFRTTFLKNTADGTILTLSGYS